MILGLPVLGAESKRGESRQMAEPFDRRSQDVGLLCYVDTVLVLLTCVCELCLAQIGGRDH